MGLGGVAIATLPSVIFSKLMFSDGLGGYPIVLWELSLIAVQSYYFLLKYLLRHSHSPQFNVLCQEKQQGICKHSS